MFSNKMGWNWWNANDFPCHIAELLLESFARCFLTIACFLLCFLPLQEITVFISLLDVVGFVQLLWTCAGIAPTPLWHCVVVVCSQWLPVSALQNYHSRRSRQREYCIFVIVLAQWAVVRVYLLCLPIAPLAPGCLVDEFDLARILSSNIRIGSSPTRAFWRACVLIPVAFIEQGFYLLRLSSKVSICFKENLVTIISSCFALYSSASACL